MEIDDGTTGDSAGLPAVPYEEALAAGSPARDFAERSPDDLYVLYTGGSTGMPKGVMWRQEDVWYALGGGIDAYSGEPLDDEYGQSKKAAESAAPLVSLCCPPLMHGAAQWGTLRFLFEGNTVVFIPKFSAEGVWRLVEREHVATLSITGDAMARPLIEWLDDNPDTYDVSSLVAVGQQRGRVHAVGEGPLLQPLPQPDPGRRHRLHRDRATTASPRRAPATSTRRASGSPSRGSPGRWCSTTTSCPSSPARAWSACWPAAATSRSATTRTR